MTKTTFDRWLLGAAGLVALLVAAAVLTFQNTRRLNEDAGRVAHTHVVMDTLKEVIGYLRQLDDAERALLQDRSEQREYTYHSALISGLVTGVAAVVGVIAFVVLLRRHLAARMAAATMIAERGEHLRTSLAAARLLSSI